MGSQCHLVHQLQQQGSAFTGQIPVPQPNLTSWKLREEVGKQKEVLPLTLVLHTNSSSTAKIHDFILSQYCAIWCYSLWGCCCTGFPGAAPLYSVMTASSTEDPGSLGRLSTTLVWGISYQLLLLIES